MPGNGSRRPSSSGAPRLHALLARARERDRVEVDGERPMRSVEGVLPHLNEVQPVTPRRSRTRRESIAAAARASRSTSTPRSTSTSLAVCWQAVSVVPLARRSLDGDHARMQFATTGRRTSVRKPPTRGATATSTTEDAGNVLGRTGASSGGGASCAPPARRRTGAISRGDEQRARQARPGDLPRATHERRQPRKAYRSLGS